MAHGLASGLHSPTNQEVRLSEPFSSLLQVVLYKVGCPSKFENTVELFNDGTLRQPLRDDGSVAARNMAVS